MATFREDMADLKDELQAVALELGLRERVVALRSTTYDGRDEALQIPGTPTNVDVELEPRPSVREVSFRSIQTPMAAGGAIAPNLEEGDLVIGDISRRYSEETLRGAELWLVDGIGHRLVHLERKATSWSVIVRRARS